MSDVSAAELTKKIKDILKTADLTVVTSKIVRGQLEEDLGCSLLKRKKEIDAMVVQAINDAEDSESGSDSDEKDKESEESEEEQEEVKPKLKRAAPARKAPAKKKQRKSANATDSNSDSDDGSDEDYKQKKKPAAKKGKAGSGPKRGTGFTRPYTLSPELSALMGEDSLPRHAVVKKIWAIIKERNLYDPDNKQFAICDEQLMSVMKIKRFRTFGMLKYLKPHFIN